jgi:hypothetical protein
MELALGASSALQRSRRSFASTRHFAWLNEIEKDTVLVSIPRSKSGRLVLTERLVEAGLTLIQEAETFGKTALACASGVRNGLRITLLALHPVRIKNFAALAIGDTFVNVDGRWRLHIPAENTKSNRMTNAKFRNLSLASSTDTLKSIAQCFAMGKMTQRFGFHPRGDANSRPKTWVS